MTIARNASAAPNLTTLVAVVTQAGPPTDQAFGQLTEDGTDARMMDETRKQFAQVLTCLVVAAAADAVTLGGVIQKDGGSRPHETVGGCTMTATMGDANIVGTDETGREAIARAPNVVSSNGVAHVIDRVLLSAGQAVN